MTIVVVIIAILIAIAIPTFIGATDRAQDRAVEANVLNAIKAVKVSGSDAGGYSTLAFADLPIDEPQLAWVAGSVTSTGSTSISVTIDNGQQVVTVAALHDGGDCYLIRDWFNQTTGTEFAVVAASAGLDCRADNGTNGAVVWNSSW